MLGRYLVDCVVGFHDWGHSCWISCVSGVCDPAGGRLEEGHSYSLKQRGASVNWASAEVRAH